jgi:UDP-GlcNAc:undecaprenyl-phosphate GlcNAc-1-phosphate transferase
MWLYLTTFLLALFLTIIFTPMVRSIASRLGAIDQPNQRKVHTKAVPRLGGIAIFLGLFLALFVGVGIATSLGRKIDWLNMLGIFFGSFVILVVGVIDDKHSLPPKIKFFWQTIAALIAMLLGVGITYASNPFNGLMVIPFYISIPLTFLWIVGITNALNLIDGLDGLASGVTAISAGTLFFVALKTHQIGPAFLMLALAGAALGFLKYNFFPASIFLGDSGSYLLGFILATASITGVFKTTLVVALMVPILILGVPIFDTLFAIGRRLKNKKNLFEADNKHIHHMLLRAGFNKREAVLSIYIACFILSFIAMIMALQR